MRGCWFWLQGCWSRCNSTECRAHQRFLWTRQVLFFRSLATWAQVHSNWHVPNIILLILKTVGAIFLCVPSMNQETVMQVNGKSFMIWDFRQVISNWYTDRGLLAPVPTKDVRGVESLLLNHKTLATKIRPGNNDCSYRVFPWSYFTYSDAGVELFHGAVYQEEIWAQPLHPEFLEPITSEMIAECG